MPTIRDGVKLVLGSMSDQEVVIYYNTLILIDKVGVSPEDTPKQELERSVVLELIKERNIPIVQRRAA